MKTFLHRSLGLLLAMALVVAGLPIAHAMPDVPSSPPTHAAMHRHVGMAMASADHPHQHDMAIDAADDRSDADQPTPTPCKCLNCSMCVASLMQAPVHFATPLRRIVAVTYRSDVIDMSGIAIRIEPGIPILAV
jgi:hypothetical protein